MASLSLEWSLGLGVWNEKIMRCCGFGFAEMGCLGARMNHRKVNRFGI